MEATQASKKRKEPETNSNAVDEDTKELVEYVNSLSNKELREILQDRNIKQNDILDKVELVNRVKDILEKDRQQGIPFKRKKGSARKDCPYLDTINRKVLDFDFEKLCSVTLQNLNVYACLVCGKYFQGRGVNSPAYTHALQGSHYVFINLHNEKVYCLPEDYEVIDPSLADIKYNLNPTYSQDQIAKLDSASKVAVSLEGDEYIPGFLGLNNIKHNDYINAVIQGLIHVIPLRNFFMNEKNYSVHKDPLLLTFGELVRKMYNPKNFKSHVSPHELLQAISVASNKKFSLGALGDPLEFIQYFLNHLHRNLGGGKKAGSSIIYQCFQGFVEVKTEDKNGEVKVETQPYLNLSLDIPPPPLFKDEEEKNIIPQIPIFTLFGKYDGNKITHNLLLQEKKKYRIVKTPQYLIIHMKRFTKNNFFLEKNPTIVTFPLKNFDLKQFIPMDPKENAKYDLIANICHEGEPNKGSYKIHVYQKTTDTWLEIQDLVVKPIIPQLIPLTESYIQIYEKKQ